MPAVLLGLPWLASVIGSVFSGVVAFLATYVTKRIAIVVAALAILVTLTVGFIAALEALASGLTLAVPQAALVGLVVPPEFSTLLAAYITGRLLWWAYWWNVKIVQLKLF